MVGRFSWLALAAALLVFHAELFAERLQDASIRDPSVAARWLVAALLGFAAWRVRSSGDPRLRGRAGLVLLLLASLLHVGAAAPATFGHADSLLVAAPLGVAIGLLAASLAEGLGARSRHSRTVLSTTSRDRCPSLRHSNAFSQALIPRPPPGRALAAA